MVFNIQKTAKSNVSQVEISHYDRVIFHNVQTYLMGWLRNYLWLNSSYLINVYNPFGMYSLLIWFSMFLFGHLGWVFGFIFLISCHGYWQESFET